MRLALSLWTAYIAVLPIYLFGSGGLQPSHIFFLLGFAVLLMQGKPARNTAGNRTTLAYAVDIELAQRGRWVCALFGLFVFYVAVVDGAWAVALASWTPLKYASFQLFNLILVFFVFRSISWDFLAFARYTHRGFSAALAVTASAILISGLGSASRETGLFNNPNQLAFFCVNCCLVFYVSEKLGVGTVLWNRLLIAVACAICLLTLSRAGLICCSLVLLVSMLSGVGRGSKGLLVVLFVGALVFVAGSIGLMDRLEARNQQTRVMFDNQIEGRGYDRMLENPGYLILGAGEGEYRRFSGKLASIGGELHSSLGTLVFCYGIIGFVLYSSLWYLMISSGPGLAFKLCACTPVIYGISHNGLRFSAGVIATILIICGGTVIRFSASRNANPVFS